MLVYAQVGASAYSPAGTDNHYVVYLNTGEPHARPERAWRDPALLPRVLHLTPDMRCGCRWKVQVLQRRAVPLEAAVVRLRAVSGPQPEATTLMVGLLDYLLGE
jgi:hypothetical protein